MSLLGPVYTLLPNFKLAFILVQEQNFPLLEQTHICYKDNAFQTKYVTKLEPDCLHDVDVERMPLPTFVVF